MQTGSAGLHVFLLFSSCDCATCSTCVQLPDWQRSSVSRAGACWPPRPGAVIRATGCNVCRTLATTCRRCSECGRYHQRDLHAVGLLIAVASQPCPVEHVGEVVA